MSKITKRSYRRKKIIMGASLFGAIGLVSVGFAAWVLSAPAQTSTNDPSLKVGQVTDKNMKFSELEIYNTDDPTDTSATFSFNPVEDDDDGRVRWGVEGDDDKPEILSLTVSGSLTHAQNLGTMYAQIAKVNGVDEALEKEYIQVPEAYNVSTGNEPTKVLLWNGSNQSTLFNGTMSDGENGEKTLSFTYRVEFAWGSLFEGDNPSVYFDSENGLAAYPEVGDGDSEDLTEVSGVLNNLHDLLDNIHLTLTLIANPN